MEPQPKRQKTGDACSSQHELGGIPLPGWHPLVRGTKIGRTSRADANPDRRSPVYCKICDTLFNGDAQYEDHLLSSLHRKTYRTFKLLSEKLGETIDEVATKHYGYGNGYHPESRFLSGIRE